MQEKTYIAQIDQWRVDAAIDILDKQYRLYSWNDQKAATLITVNSVLLAAIGFLSQAVSSSWLSIAFLMIALFLVSLSLGISLLQVMPQGSSGKSGTKQNVRSMRGIASFDNWQQYHDECLSRSKQEFIEDCHRQIYGMTIINDKSRSTTKKATIVTIIAIILIVVSPIYFYISMYCGF